MQTPYELLLGWRYTRAGRSTRRNGFISFISAASIVGIALGVAALIIVLSVMNGFQKEVRDRMLGVVSHIEIFAPGGAALLAYVPVINLVAPAYAGLAFVHYMLETLRRHRLKYGVTVLDADPGASQRKLL